MNCDSKIKYLSIFVWILLGVLVVICGYNLYSKNSEKIWPYLILILFLICVIVIIYIRDKKPSKKITAVLDTDCTPLNIEQIVDAIFGPKALPQVTAEILQKMTSVISGLGTINLGILTISGLSNLSVGSIDLVGNPPLLYSAGCKPVESTYIDNSQWVTNPTIYVNLQMEINFGKGITISHFGNVPGLQITFIIDNFFSIDCTNLNLTLDTGAITDIKNGVCNPSSPQCNTFNGALSYFLSPNIKPQIIKFLNQKLYSGPSPPFKNKQIISLTKLDKGTQKKIQCVVCKVVGDCF